MVIVLGRVEIQSTRISDALDLAQQHVLRSRAELGCLEHGVHRSHEQDNTLVFIERWKDRQALLDHFQVPASKQFVKLLSSMAVAPPIMEIYNASPT